MIEKVIDEIDKKVDQVLIEAIIVEASDSFDEQLGARLGFSYTQLNPGETGIQNMSGLAGKDTNLADTDGNLALSATGATSAGEAGNLTNYMISGAPCGYWYDL